MQMMQNTVYKKPCPNARLRGTHLTQNVTQQNPGPPGQVDAYRRHRDSHTPRNMPPSLFSFF